MDYKIEKTELISADKVLTADLLTYQKFNKKLNLDEYFLHGISGYTNELAVPEGTLVVVDFRPCIEHNYDETYYGDSMRTRVYGMGTAIVSKEKYEW